MSYQTEREDFIARMAREGWRMDLIRATLRAAATLQRLAVAQCNGDWPADNGERKVTPCDVCGSAWAPSVLVRVKGHERGSISLECPDCRTAERLRARIAAEAPEWACWVNGDPRGYVVKLHAVHETREDLQSGRARTVGVPARG